MRLNLNIALLLILLTSACTGSPLTTDVQPDSSQTSIVEAGNPPSPIKPRKLLGQVPTDPNTGDCLVTEAISTDRFQKSVRTQILSDCSFEMSVKSLKEWRLEFRDKNSTLFKTIFFEDTRLHPEFFYYVASSENPIEFGLFVFEANQATPEFQPALQNDRDGDGIVDFDDADDNGNGVLDKAEAKF